MGEKMSNYYPAQIQRIDKDFAADTIRKLRHISGNGKPKDNQELRERIDEYFSFCEQEKMRPGIEGLALALGVTRQTVFNWSRQVGCDAERAELITQAKQYIITFLEVAGMTGNLNPPCWIFSMKNVASWSDQISIETVTPQQMTLSAETIEQIMQKRQMSPVTMPEVPDLEEVEQ